MLVVVKKPHIEIEGESIPEELLQFLHEHYGSVELFSEDEELFDITETEWYREMKNDSSPGDILKRYRKRAGLSQSQLAEKLGMVKQNISAMENGSRGISKTTAHRLSEIFQVSPARFI
jgi:DNA-binding XRE family transcriptional regulator